MYQVFIGITPFIAITLFGYIMGKIKIFDLKNARILNLFLFYLAGPALIIKIVTQSQIEQIDTNQIISYFIMQSITGFIAFYLTRKFFKRSLKEAIIWALTVSLANHVILILPIAEVFFSYDTVIQVSSIVLLDTVVCLSVISFFLELTTKKKIKFIEFLKNLILNPLIFSTLVGLIIKFTSINISGTSFEYTIVRLADCMMPVGLFAIGITFSYYSAKVINNLTLTISIIKLIISPLVLILISYSFFSLSNPIDISGAFLVSVGPCGASSIIMCSAYNINPENVIKALFISTFASIFTIIFAINLLS